MKRCLTVLVVMVFVFVAASPMVLAATKDPVKETAQYTGNVVTGSVNTVGEATKETTETAVSPLVAFWRAITGQGKAQNVVTDPLEKGGKTVYDATVNTGQTVTGQKK